MTSLAPDDYLQHLSSESRGCSGSGRPRSRPVPRCRRRRASSSSARARTPRCWPPSTSTPPRSGTTHDEPDIGVVPDPGTEPDVVVTGPAAALDTWLWRRGGDDQITVAGDAEVYDRFRKAVNHPTN